MTDDVEQRAQDGSEAGDDSGVQELFDQVQQAVEEFVTTLHTLSEKLASLQPVANDVGSDTLDELSESLHALAERAPAAGNEFKQADQAITDGLHDTISSIEDRVHAAGADAASAVARIGDEERELDESFSRLQASLGDTLSRISAAYDEYLHALEATQRELAEYVAQRSDEQLTAGTDQIVSALGQFTASAEDIVRQLIELLAQAVMGLADAVEQSVQHAESERAPAQLALDAVKLVLDPLMEEVGRVKDLAESVGVSV